MFTIEVIPKNTQYCYTLIDKTVSESGKPILKIDRCPRIGLLLVKGMEDVNSLGRVTMIWKMRQ